MTWFNIICHKKSKKYQKKQKKKNCHRWDLNRGRLSFWKSQHFSVFYHTNTYKEMQFWHFLRWFQQRKWPFVLIFGYMVARHTTHILSQKPHQKSLIPRRRCDDRQTDRRTDRQSADNSVLFPRGKCAKKYIFVLKFLEIKWTLTKAI